MSRRTQWLRIVQAMHKLTGTNRRKPIFGGLFHGNYRLETRDDSLGKPAVFYVVHTESGAPISFADSKSDALSGARRILETTDDALLRGYFHACIEDQNGVNKFARRNRVPRVQVKREQILLATEGRCYYCSTPLALNGKWHVEHRIPRVLGGTDDDENLVASCVSCNLKKGAKTAGEFKALTA